MKVIPYFWKERYVILVFESFQNQKIKDYLFINKNIFRIPTDKVKAAKKKKSTRNYIKAMI